MIKWVGIISGALTSISMIPQFLKLLKKKDSRDISIGMLIVLIIGMAGWSCYGMLINDPIIITTSSFSFLVNSLTLILSIKFRR
jgi:MtN3 and saliva related transmembrane protein